MIQPGDHVEVPGRAGVGRGTVRQVDQLGRVLVDVYLHVSVRTEHLCALQMGVWVWEPGTIVHLGDTWVRADLCTVDVDAA